MSQNQSIIEPHQVSTNHSSIVKFASIIANLYNSESSNQSRSLRPGFSPLLFVPLPPMLLLTKMATSLKDFIPHFFGQDINDEEKQEDLAKFLKNLYFVVNSQGYTDKSRKLTATRVIFQTDL